MVTDFHSNKYSDVYHQIMDLDGKLLHEEAFRDVSTFSSSGFFVVKRADSKANLIDSFSHDGKFVSKQWYDKVFSPRFGQKCALVRDNDKGNFMFTDGSLLSEKWSDKTHSTFTAGKQDMRAIKLNGEYIVMNENCDQITEERFPHLISKFGRAHFCVSKSFTGLTDWHKLSYDGSISPVNSKEDCFKQQ
ncbi:hypothetical protein ACMXYX_04675 [Neptuniibacter sp. QD72_48]|uniref:hypothetical protein n=1 Tax=Neptuniibacter sp. QD72_48 TaxID=3398214 RepID=UPI0039F603FB